MFHNHGLGTSENTSGAAPTPNNSEQNQSSIVRSRDSIVKERTPEPAKVDDHGIYEAMTGSRLVASRRRHDTCSEDNRPHVCMDEIRTPGIETPSPG